jgi:hypothetical protein
MWLWLRNELIVHLEGPIKKMIVLNQRTLLEVQDAKKTLRNQTMNRNSKFHMKPKERKLVLASKDRLEGLVQNLLRIVD